MSKKKEINLKSTPAAVESGDVNISYNNVLVGSLSDSGSAVLKTEMTICEHDIELEYTKPAGESVGINALNISSSSNDEIEIQGKFIVNGSFNDAVSVTNENKNAKILNTYNENEYGVVFSIFTNSDKYNVSVNNEAIPFASSLGGGKYQFLETNSSPITGNTYNLTITDKQE